MSISETNKAQKYATIAEVAAAQAKLSADKLENAPDYAAQAKASANAAESSAQAASDTITVVSGIAAQANQSAIAAAESASEAGNAASSAVGGTVRVPDGEMLNELPPSASRKNTVPVFDINAQATVKSLSDFAIIDSETGKLPVSIIPSVALTVPFVVSSQTQMLALDAQVGDVAKRTDLGYSFMLGADPASTLSNWIQLTDNVLSQLSQPSGASMIGAKDDASNPTTVQKLLDGKANKSTLLANTGATTIGATDISGAGLTVQQALTLLNQSIAYLTGESGFNVVGRFLNLTELRAFPPKAAGDIVYVASAASTSVSDVHYGGGNFQAVAKGALVDDGGVIIVPASGSLCWARTDRGEPCLTWFGVRPNSNIDNQPEIEKAALYGKNNNVAMKAPAGVIQYSKGIPVYSRSGFIGAGKQKTIFEKTTNNTFTIATGVAVDALALAIPDAYAPDGTAESSYCVFASLIGITFRRKDIADRNNAPAYGFWGQKMAVSLIKDLRFECGHFGFWGEDCWSNIFESVQFLGLGIGQYCGFSLTKLRGATYHLSGTSNVMNMVQVANYQLGFLTAALQYSTMTCCTADSIFPMTGTSETVASAYSFYNPHNLTMNSCASEGVKGAQIRISMADGAVYNGSMNISAFMGVIAQQNPLVSTTIFTIINQYSKRLSVVFSAGDLTIDGSLTNLKEGQVDGANTYVTTVGTLVDAPLVTNGAHFTPL